MSEQTTDQPRKKSRQFIRDPFVFDRICDEEDGSSMVFGVLTMLTLATAIALTFNTGTASIWSQESQNAADAAAYSGALVAANNLNAIAEMNDAMSVAYYAMMRYSIDCITFGVLANIAMHDEFVQSNRQVPTKLSYAEYLGRNVSPFTDANPPPPRVFRTSVDNFKNTFSNSGKHIDKCKDMIDAGEQWIKALAKAERAIAKATPKMIEQTIHKIVSDNFSANGQPGGPLNKEVFVSVFPKMEPELFYGNDKSSLLKEDTPGSGLLSGQSGFIFSERFVQRYEYRHPWNYNANARYEGDSVPTPNEWYEPMQGRSKGGSLRRGFYQYRVCWNYHDYIHSALDPSDRGVQPAFGQPKHGSISGYSQFRKNSPNGHWHSKHKHLVIATKYFPFVGEVTFPRNFEHYSGHLFAQTGIQDPTIDYDPSSADGWTPKTPPSIHAAPLTNLGQHHATERCPTCNAAHQAGHDYSLVKVYETRQSGNPSDVGGNLDDGPYQVDKKYRELLQNGDPKEFQPLVMTKNIANFGINVAVAVIPQKDKIFVPKLFENPTHGYLAMASAKVGLIVNLDGTEHEISIPKSGGAETTWLSNVDNIRQDANNMFISNQAAEEDYNSNSMVDVDLNKFKDTYFSGRLTPLTLNCWGSNGSGGAVSFTTGLQGLLLSDNWKPAGAPTSAGSTKVSDELQKNLVINNNTKDVIFH